MISVLLQQKEESQYQAATHLIIQWMSTRTYSHALDRNSFSSGQYFIKGYTFSSGLGRMPCTLDSVEKVLIDYFSATSMQLQ